MKLLKRRIMLSICTLAILAFNSITVFAAVGSDSSATVNSNTKVNATITITDPDTGKVWEWNIPNSDIQIRSANTLAGGNNIKTASVSVDAGKYLAYTYYKDISTSLDDDIVLTTGLSYSEDTKKNTVSIRSVFGSTKPSGLYYATNRNVYWRNPGGNIGGKFYPKTNSWSYSTDSTPCRYDSQLSPYSLAECDVYVSGMENTHRTISVTCTI